MHLFHPKKEPFSRKSGVCADEMIHVLGSPSKMGSPFGNKFQYENNEESLKIFARHSYCFTERDEGCAFVHCSRILVLYR